MDNHIRDLAKYRLERAKLILALIETYINNQVNNK